MAKINVNGVDVDLTPEQTSAFMASIAMLSIPTVADYQNAVQRHIDETAVSKQFADGVTLASYKDSTVPAWAAQATAFIAWRDAVWTFVYAQLAAVQAGTITQPTIAQLIAELPAIAWPS